MTQAIVFGAYGKWSLGRDGGRVAWAGGLQPEPFRTFATFDEIFRKIMHLAHSPKNQTLVALVGGWVVFMAHKCLNAFFNKFNDNISMITNPKIKRMMIL